MKKWCCSFLLVMTACSAKESPSGNPSTLDAAECARAASVELLRLSGQDGGAFIRETLIAISKSRCPSPDLIQELDKKLSLVCDSQCFLQEK